MLLPPEKAVFELMRNLKFIFSQSRPGSVHVPPKPILLFKFSNFWGCPENTPNHILSSNSAGKILTLGVTKFEKGDGNCPPPHPPI